MSEVETKAPKKEVVYTAVVMEDGRTVSFAGERQADKTVSIDDETGQVRVRIDFRNGKSVEVGSDQLSGEVNLVALGHGLSQKLGDSYASVKEVDDMHLAAEEMAERLRSGDWTKAREAGDSMSGASVVIRAICEATGKPVDAVKAFLKGKLDAAKEAGEKLSRQELYSSFRNPATKTGQIIKRLEEEKLSKNSKVDAEALLAEMA